MAKFLKTDGDYLEAIIEVAGQRLVVMDDFQGSEMRPGHEFNVELSAMIIDPGEWEDIFSGNKAHEKGLKRLDSWGYLAFGEVESMNPVIVDCGLLKVTDPFFTHDIRCLGEFVAFRVARLDACKGT